MCCTGISAPWVRAAASDQCLRANARLHCAAGLAIRYAVADRNAVQSTARSGFRAALHHHAIEVVPLLAIAAVVATFTWRRTGSSLPGALICGIFVTWYVVAGTATQAAF